MRYNVMIIAGYDALADRKPEHRKYIEACFKRAKKEKIELIICVGGATNPDYPQETGALANCQILQEEFSKDLNILDIELAALPEGNTSAEALRAALSYCAKCDIEIRKLILCAEKFHLPGFVADALMVGLPYYAEEIACYGHPFPKKSFSDLQSQQRKMLLRVASHYIDFFDWLRQTKKK